MDHAPIYRADEQRTPAPLIPLRRSASLFSAAAALALGGIALGSHGFTGGNSDALAAAAHSGTAISVPVPNVAFPLVDGGHPDLLQQLSTSLLTHVAPVAPLVIPVTPPAPAPIEVTPLPTEFTLSIPVDIAPAVDATVDTGDVEGPQPVVLDTVQDAPPAPAPVVQRAIVAPVAVAQDDTPPVEVDAATVDDDSAAQVDDSADAAPPPPTEAPTQAPVKKVSAPAPAPVIHIATPVPEPPRVEIPPRPVEVVVPEEHRDPQPQARDDGGQKGPPPQQPQAQPKPQQNSGPPAPAARNTQSGSGNNSGNKGGGGGDSKHGRG